MTQTRQQKGKKSSFMSHTRQHKRKKVISDNYEITFLNVPFSLEISCQGSFNEVQECMIFIKKHLGIITESSSHMTTVTFGIFVYQDIDVLKT